MAEAPQFAYEGKGKPSYRRIIRAAQLGAAIAALLATEGFAGDACPQGTPTSGRYYVTGTGVPFLSGPGNGFPAVVNARIDAPRVLSPSYVLSGLCTSGEWLYAEIVEVDRSPVRWEKGWVRQTQVSATPSGDGAVGLLWDIAADRDVPASDKAPVRAGALKVLRDERNCAAVTTGARSASKPGTYFVTCTPKSGFGAFNVWFTPERATAMPSQPARGQQ